MVMVNNGHPGLQENSKDSRRHVQDASSVPWISFFSLPPLLKRLHSSQFQLQHISAAPAAPARVKQAQYEPSQSLTPNLPSRERKTGTVSARFITRQKLMKHSSFRTVKENPETSLWLSSTDQLVSLREEAGIGQIPLSINSRGGGWIFSCPSGTVWNLMTTGWWVRLKDSSILLLWGNLHMLWGIYYSLGNV